MLPRTTVLITAVPALYSPGLAGRPQPCSPYKGRTFMADGICHPGTRSIPGASTQVGGTGFFSAICHQGFVSDAFTGPPVLPE